MDRYSPVTSIAEGHQAASPGPKSQLKATSQQITTQRKQYHLQYYSKCNSLPGERQKAVLYIDLPQAK